MGAEMDTPVYCLNDDCPSRLRCARHEFSTNRPPAPEVEYRYWAHDPQTGACKEFIEKEGRK